MHRTVPVFVLALSLSLTAAPDFLGSFWTKLSALWIGTEAGCTADPNGRCLPAPLDNSDEGCTADPNGGCKPGS